MSTGKSLIEPRRAETIEIGKGVEYAKVVTRLREMLGDNAECSIETKYDILDGVGVVFRATVSTSRGMFTGHSFAKIGGKTKQFEKQETIAVGRALAFAGYLASGEIASIEEMAEFDGGQSVDDWAAQKSTQMVGIGKAQLEQIYRDWHMPRHNDLKGMEKRDKWGLFSEWVKDASGIPAPDHHSKWLPVQYGQCLAKIAKEAEPEEPCTN